MIKPINEWPRERQYSGSIRGRAAQEGGGYPSFPSCYKLESLLIDIKYKIKYYLTLVFSIQLWNVIWFNETCVCKSIFVNLVHPKTACPQDHKWDFWLSFVIRSILYILIMFCIFSTILILTVDKDLCENLLRICLKLGVTFVNDMICWTFIRDNYNRPFVISFSYMTT